MRISDIGQKPRHHRYACDRPVKMRSRAHDAYGTFDAGTVRDVSLSGVAMNITTNFANGQFVEMHIEGLGAVAGNVARTYDGGAAVQFDGDEDTRKRVAATINSLNRLT